MAFRLPPRKNAQRVTLPEAGAHICEAAPDLEPDDVALAILEAIQSGDLTVAGVDEPELSLWRKDPWLDWNTGGFTLDGHHVPMTLKRFFTPTVALHQVIALFDDSASPDQQPAQVSEAELKEFCRALPTWERLTRDQGKARADGHFSPRIVPVRAFTSAFKEYVGRRAPGEHAATVNRNKSFDK